MKSQSLRSFLFRFFLYEFLTGFHFFSAVLVPFFTDWGGTTQAVGQSLQSWFTFCVFLLEIPTGLVSDRLGHKYSLVFSSVMVVVATITYSLVPNLWLFALAEFFFAVGVALKSGADKALLYESLKLHGAESQMSVIWGRTRSLHLLGILLAAPIGSYIAEHLGINYPMLLTAIPAFASAVIAWTISSPPSYPNNGHGYLHQAISSLSYIKSHPTLSRATVNMTLVASAAYFVIWLYQPFMQSLGLPIGMFGLAHAAIVISEVVISFSFGLPKKLLGHHIFTLTGLLVALAFVLAGLVPSSATLVIFLLIGGGFGLTRSELITADLNHHIPSENRATVNSGISMFTRVSQAILNPFVGLLADHSLRLALFVVGLLPLLALKFPLKPETPEDN